MRLPFTVSRLDIAAMGFAALLSLACLLRGANNDSAVALLLLASLPLLALALQGAGSLNPMLCALATALFGSTLLVVLLQMALPPTSATGQLMHDATGFAKSIGRVLLLAVTFLLALLIGSHAASARLFLHALLISGVLCLCITFFVMAEPPQPGSSARAFRHGFANANAAAAYLGVMLLLTLAQAARFFRFPHHDLRKFLLDLFDRVELKNLLHGSVLVFALLLCVSGLLLTSSRGGIACTVLAALAFMGLILHKLQLVGTPRRLTQLFGLGVMLLLLVWGCAQYGQALNQKLAASGLDSNTRLDVYAAVLPMIAEQPLLGSGLGSFAGAFQPYRPAHISAEGLIDKAHNSYLEFAAEMGVPALLVLLVVVFRVGGLLLHGVRHRHEHYVMPACGFAALLLGALYSLVDFQLQVPALGALFLAVVIVCAAQSERHEGEATPSTRVKRRVRSSKHRH